MKTPVYLDYNATTPLHPEVMQVMKETMESVFGNPSSPYVYGASARTAVENARRQVAALLGCQSHEIIFTSGGTESNNLAIKGIAEARRGHGNHIITSQIEHPAVVEVCRYLETKGFRITWLPVDATGLVSAASLEEAITRQTILVTIMHANNEVGTIQPVRVLASVAHRHGILFHTDAAQSAGKITLHGIGADMVSLAGHKLYAPKGVGALYIREGIRIEKQVHGADHEHDLRAGTENVISITGLGKACELAVKDMKDHLPLIQERRDQLMQGLMKAWPDARLNGHPVNRLPNTLSLSFPGLEAQVILSAIGDEVAASAGAACHSDKIAVSPTLAAMKVPENLARGTIRFSTGRFTTKEEIDLAIEKISSVLAELGGKKPAGVPSAKVRLTQYTQGLGCACKLRPQMLEKIMKNLPARLVNEFILVGNETYDDAAVYQVNDNQAIVQTLDFFTPVVDDPYDFGAVAAANALSDIYAMGAKPLFALNIACFPSGRLPLEALDMILKGAADKSLEAGISILGGHTVEDPEPKFGMAVTGLVSPGRILRNNTARPGDLLVLTKPIGSGILATALKRGMLDENAVRVFTGIMASLNKDAAEVMESFPLSACTDITGYGLLGHLREMTIASHVDAEISAMAVPLMDGASDLASAGIIPGGAKNNLDFVSSSITYDEGIPEFRRLLLCDPQTSGGLLMAIHVSKSAALIQALQARSILAATIGRILNPGEGRIRVTL